MDAHVLLNLLNELRERDNMRDLPTFYHFFANELDKFSGVTECLNILQRYRYSGFYMSARVLLN